MTLHKGSRDINKGSRDLYTSDRRPSIGSRDYRSEVMLVTGRWERGEVDVGICCDLLWALTIRVLGGGGQVMSIRISRRIPIDISHYHLNYFLFS